MKTLLYWLAVLLAVPVCAGEPARFNWFEYAGRDSAYSAPLPRGWFNNPILAGYYPDPSITRVGNKYYLANSSFAHWPGIPIHESTDLVHWKLVGHALSNPAAVSFDGLRVSKGVFAPAIEHHDGVFYVVNTLMDSGGNFLVTATDPAGPWSDPVFLPEIEGIDPSLFFDTDGKAYIVNNGPPEGKPLYSGHRAIWIQQFDVGARKLVGPRKVLVNGGTDLSRQPIWIEGPHLYHIGGWYYLLCAEGGTEHNHSEVVFRAKSPWGPFESYAGNPILTQRDLPAGRADAVTNAGHADLVQMQDGSWWAVFLASRPYQDFLFNTGRETFLLPVTWKDGWPVILEPGKAIALALPGPRAMNAASARDADALAGNFTKREEFDGRLGPEWITVHVPRGAAPGMAEGSLLLQADGDATLADKRHAGFLARRQQHQNFDATTELADSLSGIEAGIAAYQNESRWVFFGLREVSPGEMEVFLRRMDGPTPEEVAVATIARPVDHSIRLRISGTGATYSFLYDSGSGWRKLREGVDATFLSTEKAGGFVGTVIGPYVQQSAAKPYADREEWVPLFNGRDLSGWTPKITGHDLGENFGNTFRVENGLLEVRYDGYRSFDRQFGYLFWKDPYSFYRIRVEYRFVGQQAPGDPGSWSLRNSGVMLHSPDPRTMPRDQDFPLSIEGQLLGGNSDGKRRPTANVCTPGTEIVYRGRIHPDHCLDSLSPTFDGEQWVEAMFEVHGSGAITHYVNGRKVLEYEMPQFGGGGASHFDAATKTDGQLIDSGWISLQSESHPIDFRRVELLNLAGCMDRNASNYKSYFVKHVPADCRFAAGGKPALQQVRMP